jgi:TonB family protein
VRTPTSAWLFSFVAATATAISALGADPVTSSLIQPPTVLSQKAAIYPFEMWRRHITGEVMVDFTVNEKGRVEHPIVVMSTNPTFDEYAVDAAVTWKFKPGLRDGKAVATHLRQPVEFSFEGPPSKLSPPMPGFKIARAEPGKKPAELDYLTPPTITNLLLPVYPYAQLHDGVVGKAEVTISVDERGRVAGVTILSADRPEFGLALAAAAAEFAFAPARQGDTPIAYPAHYEQVFDKYPLRDDNSDRLLALEEKHPERIVSASALDRPLKPVWQRSPVFPWTLPHEITTGKAIVECLVDERGHARLARVVSASAPEFGYAAVQAANAWWFEPPTREHKAVVTRVRIPFNFTSPLQSPAEAAALSADTRSPATVR